MKKIIYVDMDGVLADYRGHADEIGISYSSAKHREGFFAELKVIPGAIDALNKLINSNKYELYILSTAPWGNPMSLCEKLNWVKNHLPEYFYKRVIFSHHKNLNAGDYLIDDMLKNGSDKFTGEWIQFGSSKFPSWDAVVKYLL